MAEQTAAALGAPSGAAHAPYLSPGDRAVLRWLAAEVAELAARPLQAEKRELWYRHNALQPTRPLVFCDPENDWNEIIPPGDLRCTGELARDWEMRLRKEVFWGARMRGMWGFAESQETVGVSPAMSGEFVFPYQIPILERFGLNRYGCCEPLDRRWHLVERVPRLRRVSVSPWASVPAMAERLGKRYVFSWKPRPADLATSTFDEAAVRAYVRDALRATRDCVVEVIMKGNNTIGHDPRRVVRWVEIVREEIGAL